ncbi:hypothetical protein [Piscirickettsia litoralis]|nr:hypothetical protein [Piscirickettsia litoralis]
MEEQKDVQVAAAKSVKKATTTKKRGRPAKAAGATVKKSSG